MPSRPPRLCPTCRRIVTGRCLTCSPETRRGIDRRRGSAASRGYGHRWREKIRKPFLRDNPLCVLCGELANVPDHWPETRRSLVARGVKDPDAFHRLRALCDSCHSLHGAQDGDVVNPNVVLVAGPPCSGKNTYVTEHAEPGDVIIDFDVIMAEVAGRDLYDHDPAMMRRVHAERDRAISALLSGADRGWIISGAARARDRHRYGVPVVLLLPTQAEALRRASVARPTDWQGYVRRWFAAYEPDERDTVVPSSRPVHDE